MAQVILSLLLVELEIGGTKHNVVIMQDSDL